MKVRQLQWVVVLMVIGGCCLSAGAKVLYRFDFQPQGYSPEPGYIHVDETMMYNAGTGYGLIDADPCDAAIISKMQAGSNSQLANGMIVMKSNDDSFALDLPNGDYYVTFATGDTWYNQLQRPIIEGVYYRMDSGVINPAGTPLKLLDTWQDDWNIGPIPTDREGSYGNIRTYGALGGAAELLYFDRHLVTITDGQLNVGNGGSQTNKPINFLIVEDDTVVEPLTEALRFDFQPVGSTPEEGYIHIDETTMYNPFVGYGLIDADPCDDPIVSHMRAHTNSIKAGGVIALRSGDAFAVDLPDGEYLVTYGCGDVAYNQQQRPIVEDTWYKFSESYGGYILPVGAPLYLVDVWEDNWNETYPVPVDRSLAYGNIRTYGYNTEGTDVAEILVIKQELVVIVDGQLNVGGGGNQSVKPINFLEIVPNTCEGMLEIGAIEKLDGDLDADCYVDLYDLNTLAGKWLGCTLPEQAGCELVELGSPPYYIAEATVTVDGSLDDWSDAVWRDLDQVYYGTPSDISSAQFALKWNGDEDKIYAAVVVEDANHVFENFPVNWNTSDRIEVYAQGDANGGTAWGSDGSEYFDKAQQYAVGLPLTPGNEWAYWGNGAGIMQIQVDFEYGVSLDGSELTYEVGVPMFVWYGGRSGVPTIPMELVAGNTVGFDIVADSKRSDGGFGMLSENMMTGKYYDAGMFQQYQLVSTWPADGCGLWGFLPMDTSGPDGVPDCVVDIFDLIPVAMDWLQCVDPADPGCL